MDFLSLVNFVIQEAAVEQNELTALTWDSPEAGRRVYPRLKRYVQQAWKEIQMSRNQWEFNSVQTSQMVYPRFKFENGSATVDPVVGDQFTGADSGFTFTVRQIILEDGAWIDGDARGQMEFEVFTETNKLIPGEIFVVEGLGDAEFLFISRGSYDFGLNVADLAEIDWGTFTIYVENSAPIPGIYIPYENWMYETYSYATGAITPPMYLSQDYRGQVVFFQQTYQPFRVSFIYIQQPQQLVEATDVPTKLPAAYHEWIAWNAIIKLATFDKNNSLAAHANRSATFYKNRAETNLMPIVRWAGSRYDDSGNTL